MKEFFKDDKGNMSSLRLNLFLTLIVALYVTVYQVHVNMVDIGLLTLLYGIIYGAKNVDTHLKRDKNGMHSKGENNNS